MRTEPMFVTPADFKQYRGVDLGTRLKNNDDGREPNRFLMIVEDRIMSRIDSCTFRNFRREDIKQRPWQLELMQKAVLTQAMYVFKNSDIAMDSGYDPDKGIVATREMLEKVTMSEAAVNYLKQAGIYTHVMKNNPRYTTFD